mgnify:CR=1 FL=1
MGLTALTSWADVKVSGTVVQKSDDEPLIGVSVMVAGSKTATATDIDGNFVISVPENSELKFSYVGFEPQTLNVGASDMAGVVVKMSEDSQVLDEVVVVGYGVQKKSVVTASIAKVSSDDLSHVAPVRMDNALKGLAAGVNVTSNSGQPGEGSRVRIRGTGTINDSDPLYIVDGMPIDDAFDFVNPNDIESIEVLKDAASGAIYGARAANGVVLVTTKKGKEGKAKINYNFSYGWQSPWKRRKMTNATDYAILQNERAINGGQAPVFADPYNLTDSNGDPIIGGGTDWQDLVFNDNAPIMNHDVSVSGATDKVNYYFSLGYFTQDGIVGGNYGHSNYDRLTLRSNTTYNIYDATKERSWLNNVELGANLAYMRTHSTGVSTNSEFGSILGSALYLAPTLAPVATGSVAEAMKAYYSDYDLLTDPNTGLPYTVPGYGGSYQEINNPLAMMALQPTKAWTHKFVGNFSATVSIWDNIKYRFSYAADLSFYGNESATLQKYYLSGNNNASHTSAGKYKGNNNRWQIENVISWSKDFGPHNVGVVLGQSATKFKGDDLSGSSWGLINLNKPWMEYTYGGTQNIYDDAGNLTGVEVHYGVGANRYTEHRLASYFARGSYNYDGKYMAEVTVRRDGSSRFGANHKYGTFPSVSAGWNIHRENFMEPTRSWLSNLKLRASWGKNGNDNIPEFGYTALTAMNYNTLFGRDAQKYIGSKAARLANPDLKWEESEQTDIGLDFGFFNNALTFSADYYIKKTNGMIIDMPIPAYIGEERPLANVGDMENSGVEFELGYQFRVADVQFAIKGNASYLHNKLKNLGNAEGYLDLDGIQGYDGIITRAENGQPFPFFYGYKTGGVFQNAAQIAGYVNSKGEMLQPNAQPGDIIYVDVNGDGVIDTNDRTNIGKGTPDWTYGLNLNVAWRGLDFNLFLQGVSGADVFDGTYRSDIYSGNYPEWVLDRWTGEGTSNRVPRLVAGNNDSWKVSDLYVYDGSYLRLKNICLGYTLPEKWTRKVSISKLRFYVMAENLFTWTKYHGFDPEIASGGTSLGVDRGIYPQARTWTVGLNLSF